LSTSARLLRRAESPCGPTGQALDAGVSWMGLGRLSR
jgi:hypothetical protein